MHFTTHLSSFTGLPWSSSPVDRDLFRRDKFSSLFKVFISYPLNHSYFTEKLRSVGSGLLFPITLSRLNGPQRQPRTIRLCPALTLPLPRLCLARFFLHAMLSIPPSVRFAPLVFGEQLVAFLGSYLIAFSPTLQKEPETCAELKT